MRSWGNWLVVGAVNQVRLEAILIGEVPVTLLAIAIRFGSLMLLKT